MLPACVYHRQLLPRFYNDLRSEQSVIILYFLEFTSLCCFLDSYCNSNCHTNHWVVSCADKTHHLNVCRNGRRTCELSVRMHTIGREYGSAGREIGYKVADELGIKLYDKEMLNRAAKESGICQELFETHDEKPTNSFLYSLVMDTYSFGYSSGSYTDMPINHKVFLAQFDAIKKIAEEGPCILVGRCADYALENYDNVLSIFVHANLDARIRRIARLYDLTDAKAKEKIQKIDKQRSSYYNYYSNKKWSAADSYDVCLDSSVLGIDGTAEAILKLVEIKEKDEPKRL